MKITIDRIKKIRELTGYGIMDCRKALEEAAGDEKKAVELLNIWGIEKSAKKKDRETKAGLIQSYIHGEGKIGVLIELLCETDFVARTDDFKNLAHELCLQISSMNPKDIKELLKQEYIRDTGLTIGDMIKQTIGKLGENITVSRFVRMQLGEK
ncbi:translation elongation factor Ts [Candidatus Gottesmanbacteria bacterium RIFCSPHIGHO2_02_FULL_40_24]|uniref:Elongation factor Ts n=1 Tax=Candidatus Gottesmanbacteria bacterium RIFCSPHIGHO2_01_FULL_40_15 TaxID=1798376 RepID=A0A1F5Z0Z2_9BACT|nr:MAG: translation elongation factor Ts [Candidatus Gottesmanbacteria bacterium RIFCSPHIGHO2_01_FULL_40_15]OGG17467.1 MAG: translation elongation factor Ts [Candidatus Gottesmanbacteria bacterium RIFCSPHIGHO2_02_FULL_40_24]OGG21527.1 MAG: translation elongation factor Ts [Candidatus Gottesmanbacteria bacterium RIFCSPLOWO2_01_FULL_40_10]OGG25110.1 MAG: translation elongation factor Ts [Candidatus Gottesmanbacteria bacterium RIFCSPHIGHO2_12_FULL_40_13]